MGGKKNKLKNKKTLILTKERTDERKERKKEEEEKEERKQTIKKTTEETPQLAVASEAPLNRAKERYEFVLSFSLSLCLLMQYDLIRSRSDYRKAKELMTSVG